MKSTLLMSVTCAVALVIPGLAHAQVTGPNPFDPYSPSYRDDYERRIEGIERRRQYQDSLLDRYAPRPDPQVDYWQRYHQNRDRAIEACTFIDRNPAARAACLDRIR